jgi:amidophosphoribosyltransferase
MSNLSKPKEECGIFGIYAPGEDVAKIAFFGIFTLQHRGQESAGIGTLTSTKYALYKKMGLVNQIFTESRIAKLKGNIAVGHNRYSTTGTSNKKNVSPFVARRKLDTYIVAHNGNIVNSKKLRENLEKKGVKFTSTTDSEVIAQVLANSRGKQTVQRVFSTMYKIHGAYSLVIGTKKELIGVKDPLGFRPLCIGKLNNHYCLASESCAFSAIGAQYLREVKPGEVVVINQNGLTSHQFSRKPASLCIFEYIYLARPDSLINGRLVYKVREELGRRLARQHPADADVVVPVPDSSIPAAVGFSQESKIPYREGLIKNRYIARTFIDPDQRMRELGVKMKLSPLREVIDGKKVVVVDDSIVRGNTTLKIVRLLKEFGAKEVHVRITCPPLRNPCFYGVDLPTHEEFIAYQKSVEEIRKLIEADSLGYLSLENMLAAVGAKKGNGFCTACFTGKYPLKGEYLQTLNKNILEKD